MKKNSGIYAIVNRINGKRYIGSAVDIPARWRQHTYELRKNTHPSRHLQSAWNKYGQDQFDFIVLATVDNLDQLLPLEQKYLDSGFPEYNTNPVAGNMLGFRFSEEQKAKMSASHAGFRHTEESKRKMSEIWTGKPRGQYSEERRANISKSHKGKPINDNQKQALEIGRGKKSPETIQKIRDAQIGYQPTQSTIDKLKAAWVRRKERKAGNDEC